MLNQLWGKQKATTVEMQGRGRNGLASESGKVRNIDDRVPRRRGVGKECRWAWFGREMTEEGVMDMDEIKRHQTRSTKGKLVCVYGRSMDGAKSSSHGDELNCLVTKTQALAGWQADGQLYKTAFVERSKKYCHNHI